MNILTVDEMMVALALDADGTEGIVAHQIGGEWFPLVAADKARFAQIEQLAEHVAGLTGKRIELVRFEKRTSIRTIEARPRQ